MKNNQKNTLFLSSALQDSLNRISHMYDGYLQTIFSSDSITSQIGQLQEEMVKSYKHFFQLYTPSMFFARPFCIKLQKLFVGRCSCIL